MKTSINPKYAELLGSSQAKEISKLFSQIVNGKYDKTEVHSFVLKGMAHPVYLRAILADMQSFVNTFIDPYLDHKSYMKAMHFVVDAGSNIGYTAALFANRWPDCKIICLEPDKENYEFSLMNTNRYPNIEVIHAALWNKETPLKIEAGQEDGFVVREMDKNVADVKPENLTKGISLDALMDHYKQTTIDFLKVNIEGSEKELFGSNYERWLPNTGCMLVELHDGKNPGCSKTVFTTINRFPFSVAETAPYGVLFVKEDVYTAWYAQWYREMIYNPNIDKNRFPEFYLDR